MKIGITDYAEKYIEEHTTRKKYYSEESCNKIKQKLETYENMRKELINIIEYTNFIEVETLEKFRSYLDNLLNILNKVGSDK